jgi:hypothetical protein
VNRARQTTLLTALAVVTFLAALQWAGWLGLGQGETVTLPVAPARPAIHNGSLRPGGRIASLNTATLDRALSGGIGGRDPWRFVDPPPVPQRRSKEPQSEAPARRVGAVAGRR